MKGNNTNVRSYRGFIWVVMSAMLVTAYLGNLPQIYGFATNPELPGISRLLQSPVHLADDVMISLRTGYILNETGRPAFNVGDLAQPSTSYVTPYLFAVLLNVFPENIAVMAFAFLGLLAVALTAGVIYWFSASTPYALLLIIAIVSTKTNFLYGLNGWDHLFQGLCMVLGACLSLTAKKSRLHMLAVSLLLVLGTLFRPDGALISLAVLYVLYLSVGNFKRFIFWAALPFIVCMVSVATINYLQFGHLTPTTSRLKLGASPSINYAIDYAFTNGVLNYTALTLFFVIVLFYFIFYKVIANRKFFVLFAACVGTGIVALYNSDVFPGARMFWMPVCVLVATMAFFDVNLFRLDLVRLRSCCNLSPVRFSQVYLEEALGSAKLKIRLLLGALILALLGSNALKSVTAANEVADSALAQQFVLAQWIRKSLDPADGAIGFFFLGVSYHLPGFEIADFLGKADERIATSEVKWGPPGHNKWDIDKSLDAWQPQAILPSSPSYPKFKGQKTDLKQYLERRDDYAFWADLYSNERIASLYSYCFVPSPRSGVTDQWGLFIRKDIVKRHLASLQCI